MLAFLLLFFVSSSHCFWPYCDPENQFRNFKFPVEACSENLKERCNFYANGQFTRSSDEASLVKIGETSVVPTCAFVNAEHLKIIYGVNSKIKVLATGSFRNLPNLRSIHLAFNYITEVRKDIFQNISSELLDLSWNKIAYIDSNAFEDITDLKFLNLSKNFLRTLSINHLSRTLININLASNLLDDVALNSYNFLNLTSVNISNNVISRIAILFTYPAENIDLTDNRIQDFDFININSVAKLKIGKNSFKEIPKYINTIKANEIDIYPNPWIYSKLDLLEQTLESFNIRLAPRKKEKNPPSKYSDANNWLTERYTECLDDYDCPSFKTCRAEKCWDPCEESLCHSTRHCDTIDHALHCFCSGWLLADPLDIQGECKKVQCFTNSHCRPGLHCLDQKCISSENGGLDGGGLAVGIPFGGVSYNHPVSETYPDMSLVPWWFDDIPNFAPPATPSMKQPTAT